MGDRERVAEQWAELRRLIAAGYSAEAAEMARSLAALRTSTPVEPAGFVRSVVLLTGEPSEVEWVEGHGLDVDSALYAHPPERAAEPQGDYERVLEQLAIVGEEGDLCWCRPARVYLPIDRHEPACQEAQHLLDVPATPGESLHPSHEWAYYQDTEGGEDVTYCCCARCEAEEWTTEAREPCRAPAPDEPRCTSRFRDIPASPDTVRCERPPHDDDRHTWSHNGARDEIHWFDRDAAPDEPPAATRQEAEPSLSEQLTELPDVCPACKGDGGQCFHCNPEPTPSTAEPLGYVVAKWIGGRLNCFMTGPPHVDEFWSREYAVGKYKRLAHSAAPNVRYTVEPVGAAPEGTEPAEGYVICSGEKVPLEEVRRLYNEVHHWRRLVRSWARWKGYDGPGDTREIAYADSFLFPKIAGPQTGGES